MSPTRRCAGVCYGFVIVILLVGVFLVGQRGGVCTVSPGRRGFSVPGDGHPRSTTGGPGGHERDRQTPRAALPTCAVSTTVGEPSFRPELADAVISAPDEAERAHLLTTAA
jgi:hypothetical protein